MQSFNKLEIYTKFKDHAMTAANLLTNLITERLLERALKLQRIINSKRLEHSQVFCLTTGATSEKTGSYQDGLETKRRPVESRKGKRVGCLISTGGLRAPSCPCPRTMRSDLHLLPQMERR